MTNTKDNCLHDVIVACQSAWIEWKHGKGAEGAMTWIENMLNINMAIPTDKTSKYSRNAQFFYNEQNSNPYPRCPCGNPSSILINDETGYCCDEHEKMHEAKLKHDRVLTVDKAIKKAQTRG
ncbi:MAG: hypothetical protein GY820_10795 [Gammaproteobacteria bacterium]|nr:hypothetical protein [Gammaproteobacteria bacterium]